MTYPQGNIEAVKLLRLSGEPLHLYAAERIVELEAENARLRAALESFPAPPFVSGLLDESRAKLYILSVREWHEGSRAEALKEKP